MTSPTLRSQISLAKCSARKRSGRPVASANWLGNNVEVFVVKIVFAGHAWFSSGYTFRLTSGFSGTDSLTMSAS